MARPAAIETTRPVYDAIKEFWEQHGYAPSIRDLSKRTGLATSNVYYHLERMRTIGCISFDDDKARTVRIIATLDETWGSGA